MCSCRTYVPCDRRSRHPGLRSARCAAPAAGARDGAGGARAAAGNGAAARLGDGCGRGEGRAAGDAARGGARDVPAARARRAGPGHGRAVVGGDPAPARGLRASRSSRSRRGRSTSRRAGSSGCTAGSSRRSSARSRRSGRCGTRARARPSGGSRRSRRRTSREPGQALIVSDDRTQRFLSPLPLTLLPLERDRYEELEELGIRTIGQLAGLPGGAVAERLGPDGRRAWSLARGEQDGRVVPRGRPSPWSRRWSSRKQSARC